MDDLLKFIPATLVKATGERTDLSAHFSPKKVITKLDTIHIEGGDVFERELPNGATEHFEVIDANWHDAFGSKRYYCDVRRSGAKTNRAHYAERGGVSMAATQPKFQVFISSTYTDLKDVRARVTRAILETENIPAGMEAFPSTDDRGWKIIRRVIDKSDYYILLLAGRYGSYDESIKMSWTHREYRYARKQGIPVLAFKRTDSSIAINEMEDDYEQQSRLKAFVGEVGENHKWTEWNTAEDLAGNVNTSLLTHIRHDSEDGRSRPGWYRGNQPPDTEALHWEMQAPPDAMEAIHRALQNEKTTLHEGRLLRVISSMGTVGYRGLGTDGNAFAVYHATGTHKGCVYTARKGIGNFVRARWIQLESILGFPTSDEYSTPTGARSDFEGGRLEWEAATREIRVFSDVVDGGRLVSIVSI